MNNLKTESFCREPTARKTFYYMLGTGFKCNLVIELVTYQLQKIRHRGIFAANQRA